VQHVRRRARQRTASDTRAALCARMGCTRCVRCVRCMRFVRCMRCRRCTSACMRALLWCAAPMPSHASFADGFISSACACTHARTHARTHGRAYTRTHARADEHTHARDTLTQARARARENARARLRRTRPLASKLRLSHSRLGAERCTVTRPGAHARACCAAGGRQDATVSALFAGSPGADVRLVPAQTWGQSQRRCGPVPALGTRRKNVSATSVCSRCAMSLPLQALGSSCRSSRPRRGYGPPSTHSGVATAARNTGTRGSAGKSAQGVCRRCCRHAGE
jgi:hypothetical protein